MADEKNNLIYERTKEYGKQLWDLIKLKLDQQPSLGETQVERVAPLKTPASNSVFLKLLFAFPYLLAIVFIFSFYWDLNGVKATLFGTTIEFEGLLRILSISGLIGFLTNWLAITMLFRPTMPRPIFGQGLVPAQKERISYRLAVAVSEDLINPDIIKQKIKESEAISKYREIATQYIRTVIEDEGFRTGVKSLALNYIDEMIAQPEVRASIAKSIIDQIESNLEDSSFEKIALRAYSFIKGQEMQQLVEEALTKLPNNVEKGLNKLDMFLDYLPEKINENSESIENIVTSLLYKLINQLDVHALVEDNLRQYDERRLEKLIKNASNDQLQYIQFLGAILGTFGGFVIWKPIASLIFLAIIISITFGFDHLLYKLNINKK